MTGHARKLVVLALIAATLVVPAAAEPSAAAAGAPDGAATCVTNPATPKRQLRAMWIASVTNIDWPSTPSWTAPDRIEAQKREYREWLDLAQRLNHNAVIVQVRPTADAFWPSPYEPWSEYLTGVRGQDPGWDPLAYLVAEARRSWTPRPSPASATRTSSGRTTARFGTGRQKATLPTHR